MWLRLAAIAAFAAWPCAWAQATARLSLDDAFLRVARVHPQLRLADARERVLEAEREHAALPPGLSMAASVENAFGSGRARALDEAEITLTLASVLERGGKLDARRALAQSRIDALAIERETQRLDLLAETARRYLAVVAARRQDAIARVDVAQRARAVDAARQRLQAGASPESVLLTAQAALARAEIEHARALQRGDVARRHLAALWGQREPDFDVADAEPDRLADIGEVDALSALLDATPELAQFAGERRIREARLRLARRAARADLEWQVGVRRLQANGDSALTFGLALPLGAARRAQPEIRAAEAELAALEIEREAGGLSLHATLVEAHGRYRGAQMEVRRLRDEVQPLLARAEAAAARAYRAGAISYLEWSQLQAERIDAQRRQLDVAVDAQIALIEIQRLTGQAFVAAPAAARAQGAQP
ncbi:TolC family protein [Pseudoxanthomonas mexicana]|uniref:TolC family protein n=1 Tax=Pseudoxanthomonas mexicana TaxID=128785 RepID=UPI00398A910C